VSEHDLIEDDEVILRHVPGGTAWQAPGPRITSGNFKLRHDRGETGVSVTRRRVTSPEQLLASLRTTPESRVAWVRVGDVRALGLRVVAKPLDHDPGHAEIQSDTASLDDQGVRKKLANQFQFLEGPTTPNAS
jgi:hypothetical protein